jgi:3-hydroxyisobutyrate dehydrogenase-like beta-hydroxyacid dehydrogenase
MKYKLILNGLQAAHMVAFGEAMKLAVQAGLDPKKVGPALLTRPGGAITEAAWTAYQKTDIPLTFSVDWITKDLTYARQLAGAANLPILDDALAAYKRAQDEGHGQEDFAFVAKDN